MRPTAAAGHDRYTDHRLSNPGDSVPCGEFSDGASIGEPHTHAIP